MHRLRSVCVCLCVNPGRLGVGFSLREHSFHGWEPRSVYDLIGDIVLRANPPRPFRIVFPGKPPPSNLVFLTSWVVAGLFPSNSHELSTDTFLESVHYCPSSFHAFGPAGCFHEIPMNCPLKLSKTVSRILHQVSMHFPWLFFLTCWLVAGFSDEIPMNFAQALS